MGEETGGPAIDPAALQAVVEMIGADEPAVIVDLIDTFLMDSAKQVEEMATVAGGGRHQDLAPGCALHEIEQRYFWCDAAVEPLFCTGTVCQSWLRRRAVRWLCRADFN